MIIIDYKGRLGNHLFQYAAACIFAKKFNLQIFNEPPKINFDVIKIPCLNFQFNKKTIEVNDENYMSLISLSEIEKINYKFTGYFQLKNFILNNKDEIKSLFDLKYDKNNNKEVFVSYRIGDIANIRALLPLEYYQECLIKLNCNKGYITSDTPNHPNVKKLSQEFNLEIYENSPEETINFAKNFDNIVLSEGTFSWWIGFLSQANNIFYNERERFWHGDIFVFPEWKKLNYDWHPDCIGPNNSLKYFDFIKHE